MNGSIGGLYAQLGFFVAALVFFVCTFFFRKPGSKVFASFRTVGETYTPGGAVCYWLAYVCLFLGIILQVVNKM
jgi:hypothetical protein